MTDSTADDILNKGQRPAGKGTTTRPSGQPVPSENTSVTAGPQGPVALNDIHLIEKLAHFNRERVPERTPHAKGHGAYGELHITEDVSAYTKAKVFQKGTVTPMMGRFPPSPASRAPRIPGATCTALPCASTPKTATSTLWAITPRYSSCAMA